MARNGSGVVHDGRAAFEAAERYRPDIGLLYIGMPEWNGHEVAQRLWAASWGRAVKLIATVKLIAITGSVNSGAYDRAAVAGFDAHVTKPVDPERLAALIARPASAAAQLPGATLRHSRQCIAFVMVGGRVCLPLRRLASSVRSEHWFQQRADGPGGNCNMAADSDQDQPGQTDSGRQPSTHLSPEREKTDEGLREERDKTDRVVAARQEDMARRANAMVHHARHTADAVLLAARDNADAVLDAARDMADDRQALVDGHADQAAIQAERAVADNAIQDERDSADEILSEERKEYAKTLRSFLPLEREFTDRSLRTERIRADKALVNRDDFLAMVSHDLRDLLGGIVLSSQVLAAQARRGDANANTLVEAERIGRHAARMGRLIGDLVDISSIDAGKLAVALTPGDLAIPISEAVDAFSSAALARGLTLESRVDAAPLAARFDYNRILQVLSNLISNALKYTPRGGTITITGERDQGDIRLTVSDTGSGIPVEALNTVFDRFAQVGEEKHGGLGLGLYISRCLVQAHGGSIEAHRRSDAGTLFCIRLPSGS